eukprot:CAMPEP_0174255922 /NCGR_PEP_ID=MMETSP0439-20130205/5205_1 /TAXON_ID=0 /ORGANISM="Stereomyxa ramosa, Strain Chinc5" /LENGTH=442 /DNA_ID=CAMNT_0015338307 /DNA_START=6 /DNA_END=1334 /DNA_ORIENTATION=-
MTETKATSEGELLIAHDLTHAITPYLDRHLVLPLLDFHFRIQVYPEAQILASQFELLSSTNLVDLAIDQFKKLHPDEEIPKEMEAKKIAVLKKFSNEELRPTCQPLLLIIDDEALVKELRSQNNYNMEYLTENHEVPSSCLEALLAHAKFNYECGGYSRAAKCLAHYRELATDPEKEFKALWGKLAAEILSQAWENASEDLKSLKEAIDKREYSSPLLQIHNRSWLIHWSLYLLFNHPKATERHAIIEMFFQDRQSPYLNAVQTICPHILRYLTAAVITNKRNRIEALVKVIQQEDYLYSDPITEFIKELYINFDFEAAQKKLQQCDKILRNDFFLLSSREDFMENARLLIFETYCRIHKRIDIGMLAEKLDMDQESAERWVVNLIRNARLDAKIDSAANHVIMGTCDPSVYQKVVAKTKGLSFRTTVLTNNILNYLGEDRN